jgi:hypothetical protein
LAGPVLAHGPFSSRAPVLPAALPAPPSRDDRRRSQWRWLNLLLRSVARSA